VPGGHQRYGQAHTFRSADSSNPVDVVLLVVGQRHVDDEGHAFDVNASSSDVSADEVSDLRT